MKKVKSILILTVFFVCILVSSFSFASKDSKTKAFELDLVPRLVNTGFYGSVDAIMDTVEDRSTITCALLIDLASLNYEDFSIDDFSDCIMNKSNILTDGNYIGVNCFFKHNIVHISYDPASLSATYYIESAGSGSDDFNCEYHKTQMEKAGFDVYINEPEEMYRVAGIILGF